MTSEPVADRLAAALAKDATRYQATPGALERTLERARRRRRVRRTVVASGLVAASVAAALSAVLLSAPAPSDRAASSVGVLVEPIAASGLSPRMDHTGIWVADRLLVWGGSSLPRSGEAAIEPPEVLDDGATYDPRAGTWAKLPRAPIRARSRAPGVWTGQVAVVAGGQAAGEPLGDGAVFDPATRSWSALSPGSACPTTMTAVQGVVYAAGSCGDGTPRLTRLDLAERMWRDLPAPPLPDVHALASTGSGLLAVAQDGQVAELVSTKQAAWTARQAVPGSMAAGSPSSDPPLVGVAGGGPVAITPRGESGGATISFYAGGSWNSLTAAASDYPDAGGVGVWGDDDYVGWGTIGGLCMARLATEVTMCTSDPRVVRTGTVAAGSGAMAIVWGGQVADAAEAPAEEAGAEGVAVRPRG